MAPGAPVVGGLKANDFNRSTQSGTSVLSLTNAIDADRDRNSPSDGVHRDKLAEPHIDGAHPQDNAMTLRLEPVVTTLIGGVVFPLPLIVVLVVLAVMGQGVAKPLAAMFPAQHVGGVALASLLARVALGRTLSASFEDRLQTL